MANYHHLLILYLALAFKPCRVETEALLFIKLRSNVMFMVEMSTLCLSFHLVLTLQINNIIFECHTLTNMYI